MRDYAHKPGLNSHQTRLASKKAARPDIAPAWGWTSLGIALGLGIALLVAMKLFPKLAGIDRTLAISSELNEPPKERVASQRPTEAPPQPKFDFYTLLPNMEEIEPKLEPKIETKAETKVETKQATALSFIVQAAVFHAKPAADNLKAQLTLQGFDVQIEPYQKNSASDTWYRVYLGPFTEEAQAKLAQASLQQTAQVASFVIKNKA